MSCILHLVVVLPLGMTSVDHFHEVEMRRKGFAMTMEGERSHRKSTSSSVGLRRVRDRRHGIFSIAMAEIYLVFWSASLGDGRHADLQYRW